MLEHRRIADCTTVHLRIVGLTLSELSGSAAAEQRVQRRQQHTKLIQDRPYPFMDMDGVPVYGIQRAIQTKEHGMLHVKD